ncbi:MAG TPA: c-type cytochrome, partial [Methylomirabilota bacterium]|nr:c-type cytochrome [Methylomirabilota bacterium]
MRMQPGVLSRSRWTAGWGCAAGLALLAAPVSGQIPEKFTNLQVLPRDTPRPELVAVMRSWASALGVRCEQCHVNGEAPDFKGTDFASDAKDSKRTARLMLKMVRAINEESLPQPRPAAAPRVECVTCHRGQKVPRTLEAEVSQALEEKGAAAAVTRYRELRAASYGRGGYDFGQGTLNQIGERLLKAGRAADAPVLLSLNLEFFPDAPWTLYLAGEAHRALGQLDQARATYERSALAGPENPLARRRLQEMGPAAEPDTRNVRLLAGLTPLELQRTMNLMRASLGVHCDFCHVVTRESGWQWEKDDKAAKVTARKMIAMVQQLNREQFAGQPVVSCFTCHRGHQRPLSLPPLPQPPPPFPTVAENVEPAGLPSA